jgi:radical SAM superfamily enzyme YgiQ (UPF0313 family)
MNVLLIQPPHPRSIDKKYLSTQIPINLAYIAASLEEEGANVKIIDFCIEKFIKEKFLLYLKKFNPKIIGFTSMTPSILFVKDIAKVIKEYDKNILIILGGMHISALPKRTLKEIPNIDIGVCGEGDITIKEIYHAKSSNKPYKNIDGIVYRSNRKIEITPKRELIKNLDKIPFPARHLFYMDKYKKSHVSRGFSRKHMKMMEIFTSRGCPNKCIYCSNANFNHYVRFRSYENIVSEIDSLIKNYQINHISIEDDTFTINKPLLKKLCKYFKEKNITWNCNARVDTVDFKLIKIMKDAGCKKISFGVESGSQRILELNKKNTKINQIKNAFKWAKKAKIRFVEGTFILGSHTDETIEEIKNTKDLMFELMPDIIMLSVMCPFPGTEINRMMIKQKLIDNKVKWDKYTLITKEPPFKRLNNITSKELLKLQKNIIKEYYSSPKYILNQILKIRSIGELSYLTELGFYFMKDFIIKK